jgi:hypothetical protein
MISLGQTLLYLEFRENEVTGLPQERSWRQVQLDGEFGPGFAASSARTMIGRQSVAFYCVRREGVAGDDNQVLRSIRLNLLRMHGIAIAQGGVGSTNTATSVPLVRSAVALAGHRPGATSEQPTFSLFTKE